MTDITIILLGVSILFMGLTNIVQNKQIETALSLTDYNYLLIKGMCGEEKYDSSEGGWNGEPIIIENK